MKEDIFTIIQDEPYKFDIGDIVRITKHGRGVGPNAMGEIVKIIKKGTYHTVGRNIKGYVIDPPFGNSKTGSHGHMISELSFELVKKCETYNRFEF